MEGGDPVCSYQCLRVVEEKIGDYFTNLRSIIKLSPELVPFWRSFGECQLHGENAIRVMLGGKLLCFCRTLRSADFNHLIALLDVTRCSGVYRS